MLERAASTFRVWQPHAGRHPACSVLLWSPRQLLGDPQIYLLLNPPPSYSYRPLVATTSLLLCRLAGWMSQPCTAVKQFRTWTLPTMWSHFNSVGEVQLDWWVVNNLKKWSMVHNHWPRWLWTLQAAPSILYWRWKIEALQLTQDHRRPVLMHSTEMCLTTNLPTCLFQIYSEVALIPIHFFYSRLFCLYKWFCICFYLIMLVAFNSCVISLLLYLFWQPYWTTKIQV